MSTALRDFCRSWLEWVERGAPEGEPYSRHHGLCSGAIVFGGTGGWAAVIEVRERLKSDFPLKQGVHPFGGGKAFVDDERAATMHLNPERLAWARKHAELEERHE